MSSNPAPRAKRGLLIGIDKYPSLRPLQGCVNDVTLMRSILLENFGFPIENVRLLTDGEATRERVLRELDALVELTGADDLVVIHYAGHGSQMTDREDDEPDGLDETIMPYDSEGRAGVNRDITDDEIHLRLVALGAKTSYITLIFDSCHSGTITRDAFGDASRSMPPDTRPKSELPPSPIPPELRGRGGERGPSGWIPLADQYVLLAGCRDEETSYEYRPPEGGGSLVHGALTYFLAQQLRQAVPGTTYRDVFERAAAAVNAVHPTQHPQMEGRADREIFGVSDIVPMRFARVASRQGDGIVLDAGAAHGMTTGSEWAIYPQGTKRAEGTEPLGRARITRVRAVTSEARIVAEAGPGAIATDARAVETVHDYGELRLAVQVVALAGFEASLAAMESGLKGSPLLRMVAEGEPASARVYLLQARQEAAPGDPVPQIPRLDEPVWAVVAPSGQLLVPPVGIGDFLKVKEDLEKLARYQQALQLDNPDQASTLRDKVSLQLLRQAADKSWIIAQPEEAGGQVVYEEGEAIALRVSSRHTAPVFVYLLDFDVTGSVSLLHPPLGAHEKLGPGESFDVGTRPGEAFKLQPLESYSGMPGVAKTEGMETVKLFVTNSKSDFGFLTQEGITRSQEKDQGSEARGPQSPLMLLLESAAAGTATRKIQRVSLGEDDWATVRESFLLRRSSSVALDPKGDRLALGDVSLQTPGLSGRALLHPGKSGRAEADELTRPDLIRQLQAAGVAVRKTIEITDAQAPPSAARGDRAEPVIELQVPDPGLNHGQMVLTTDELGVVSWHFAPVAEPALSAGRGERTAEMVRTYRLPAPVPQTPVDGPTGRSLVGAVGRKFLKVLVFPLVEPGVGAVTETFANRWEQKHRPYRIRPFGPEDYAGEAAELDDAAWRRLSQGRALLLIHGTFSRAHTAFGALPREFVETLHRRYDGRVFAFDHFTLSHDPRENVEWFLQHLPEECALDLDIMCHSRGGLVSRLLSEKQAELGMGGSRTVRVNRIVFAGAPNAGTILADADHVGDFIDSYTNLLNFVPDPGVSDVLAGIITVAKQLAVGMVKGLRGLQSMRPGGEFGTWLNDGPRAGDARYFALASDFTPVERGFKELALDRLLDKVFRTPNDLVVPTEGVFSANGSGFFPIDQKVVFQGRDAVGHTAYFGSPGAREKIAEWLVGGER